MARRKQDDAKTTAVSESQVVHGTALLGKALDIVDFVADSDRRLKFRDIAEHTGHTRSTLYRILSALTARGVLDVDSRDQSYVLGPRFTAMAGSINQSSDLIARASGPLRELCDLYGENINLAVMNGSAPVVVARWQGWGGAPWISPLGERKPLHATSLGKVFLAFSGNAGDDLMRHVDFTRYTDRTLTSRAALDADLSISRIRGFTQDDNEIIDGIVCVAAPIRYPDGELAASASFNVPAHRMAPARRTELGSALQAVAARISDDLALHHGDTVERKGGGEKTHAIEARGFETRVSRYLRDEQALFWFDVAGGTVNRHDDRGRSIVASLGRPVSALAVGTGGALSVVSESQLFRIDPATGLASGDVVEHSLLRDVISAQACDDGFVLTTETALWWFSATSEAVLLYEAATGLQCSPFNRHGIAAAMQADDEAVVLLHKVRGPDGWRCMEKARIRLDRPAPGVTAIHITDDGSITLAQANGWALWQYDADGKVRHSRPMPVPTVRTLTLGEQDGVFYCGSDRLDSSASLLRLAPLSGAVFRVDFS